VCEPIIFVGMHRSGTSLIGRLLESLGLFVGVKKDDNNEALFFQNLNEWLLLKSGAAWDTPGPINHLLHDEETLTHVEDFLRMMLGSPKAIQFLGFRRYSLAGGFRSLRKPWGWKDPRNTFTLPVWLRLFPGAKVICVLRHGVDVAQSLYERTANDMARKTRIYRNLRRLLFVWQDRFRFVDSVRCRTLEGAFSLWKEYVDQSLAITRLLPESRVLVVRYEQLLTDPVAQLTKCAEFCGLETSAQECERVASSINRNRALSYRCDDRLARFAAQNETVLSQLGYC
jgi:hypothetical protein